MSGAPPDALNVAVPDEEAVRSLADLGDRVSLSVFAADDPAIAETEFLVVPWWDREGVVEAIARMPALRVLQAVSAGVDWLVPAIPEGVALCDASGVHDAAVAEWVVAALLGVAKRLPHFLELQGRGRWEPEGLADIEGSTVLIVGHGSIGRAIEARLEPFGCEIVRVARRARPGVQPVEALPELVGTADTIVLVVPLTRATTGLFGSKLIGLMRPNALLINAARGPVVDAGALLGALQSGRIRAALDVTDPEPLPEAHPLWSAPGTLITPHVAGWTPRLRERADRLVRAQLNRYLAGEPLANVVTDGY